MDGFPLPMIRKPFDPVLFDRYDEAGKQKVADYIEWEWGCTVGEASKYGIDLVATRRGNPVGHIEVEVRNWGKDFCPFKTIHVPERKAKYLVQHDPAILFAVCSTMTAGYWCNAKRILSAPLVEVKNREVATGEKFFDVPLAKFNYVRFVI